MFVSIYIFFLFISNVIIEVEPRILSFHVFRHSNGYILDVGLCAYDSHLYNTIPSCQALVTFCMKYFISLPLSNANNFDRRRCWSLKPNLELYSGYEYEPYLFSTTEMRYKEVRLLPHSDKLVAITAVVPAPTIVSPFQIFSDERCTSVYYTTFWENVFTYYMQKQCPRERACPTRALATIESSFSSSLFVCTPINAAAKTLLRLYRVALTYKIDANVVPIFHTDPSSVMIICNHQDLCDYITPYCLESHYYYDNQFKFKIPSTFTVTGSGDLATITHRNFSGCSTRFRFPFKDYLDFLPINFYIPYDLHIGGFGVLQGNFTNNSRNDTYPFSEHRLDYPTGIPSDYIPFATQGSSTYMVNYPSSNSYSTRRYYLPTTVVSITVPFHDLFSSGSTIFGTVFSAFMDEIVNILSDLLSLFFPLIQEFVDIAFNAIYNATLDFALQFVQLSLPYQIFILLQSFVLCSIYKLDNRQTILYCLFSTLIYFISFP